MIVVIADDLSGAAELAGSAYRHGLTAEVQTQFSQNVPSTVVCLDSEGRAAASAEAAAAEMRDVFQTVASGLPDWIYFKFDSVLRGNIAAQLEGALEASGRDRALLITANPSRGRTIRGGHYLVEGVPLHRTAFACDPEFPCATSDVRELLGDDFPRILTPDIESTDDLDRWARAADQSMLTAGSAEFFEALLRVRAAAPLSPRRAVPGAAARESGIDGGTSGEPVLVVCGSRASWGTRVEEAGRRGVRIFDLLDDPLAAADALARDGSILLGIGERIETGKAPRTELLTRLGAAVAKICERVPPRRLLLEGGATAVAVVRRMGWTRLVCGDGVGRGVGTLRPAHSEDTLVLIKPGSYPWPDGSWSTLETTG